MNRFDLIDEDYEAIHVAKDAVRILLNVPRITAQQIISLGKALDALERLPDVTPDVSIEFGLSYRNGNDKFEEMEYTLFRITDREFEISRGGSTYDSSVGGDTFSRPGWRVELGGYAERDCELYNIKSSFIEYVNLGAEITIEDESRINLQEGTVKGKAELPYSKAREARLTAEELRRISEARAEKNRP